MKRWYWPLAAALVWAVVLFIIAFAHAQTPFVTWPQMVDHHMADIIKEERGR